MTVSRMRAALVLGAISVLLAACGAPAGQSVQPDPPGDFGLTALAAFCIDGDAAGVRLEWSASEGAAAYRVLRDGVMIVELGGTSTSFSDTAGPAPGGIVEYAVRASNAGGQTQTVAESFTVPAAICPEDDDDDENGEENGNGPLPPPGPIESVVLTAECAVGPVQNVRVTWSAAEGADSYSVERDYAILAELNAPADEYLDTAVAPGASHTYVVRARNETGISISTPMLIELAWDPCGLSGPVVAAGTSHSLAIASDGTVWAWGYNDSGMLGTGNFHEYYLPVQVPGLSGIVSVVASGDYSLALDGDGRIWAWGYSDDGALGLGPIQEQIVPARLPVPVDVIAIAAGYNHSLAVTSDGKAWAWGSNSSGQLGIGEHEPGTYVPTAVPGLSSVVEVAAGWQFSFARLADGSVRSWGANGRGQLGLGDTDDRHTPQPVPGLAGVTAVRAGEEFALALRDDGAVLSWGSNWGGQLGNGSDGGFETAPAQVPGLTGATGIEVGPWHSLAVLADGSVLAWGWNENNVLGTGEDEFQVSPETVPGLSGIAAAFGGGYHSLALGSDGRLHAWGRNGNNELGVNTPPQHEEFVPVALPSAPFELAGSTSHTVALLADGTVYAWGSNGNGMLGLGHRDEQTTPVQVPGLAGITSVAAGLAHTLAVDGDGGVLAWGSNLNGRLGDGTTTQRLEPVSVNLPVGAEAVAVAAGSNFSLALLDDGSIMAWGSNGNGRLGDGTTTQRLEPVFVNLPVGAEAVAIAAGNDFSLALLDDGSIMAWGSNSNGRLGDGTTTQRLVPVFVNLPVGAVAVAIAAGNNFSLALLADGSVMVWGNGSQGQHGNGATTLTRSTPAAVPDLDDIALVSAGNQHVVAVNAAGELVGWGRNDEGQLALPRLFNRLLSPERLDVNGPGASVGAVFATSQSTFVVIEGVLYGVGNDRNGQLGQGRIFRSSVPLHIESLPGVATGQ